MAHILVFADRSCPCLQEEVNPSAHIYHQDDIDLIVDAMTLELKDSPIADLDMVKLDTRKSLMDFLSLAQTARASSIVKQNYGNGEIVFYPKSFCQKGLITVEDEGECDIYYAFLVGLVKGELV